MPLYTPGRRRALLLLLLTSALLLTLDLRGNSVIDAVRSGYNKVLEPIESAADVVTNPIREAWRGITRYDEVADENRRLREQLDAQRANDILARASILDYEELLRLNSLPSLSDYPTVVATVSGASPTNIDQVIEIDRGRDDGIDVGMAVVGPCGLVGKITTPLLPDRAQVMLLSDLRFRAHVKVIPKAPPPTTTTTTTTTTIPGAPPPSAEVTDTTPPATTTTTTTTVAPETTVSPAAAPPTSSPTTTTTTLDLDNPRETGRMVGQGDGQLPQVDLLADNPVIGRIVRGDLVLTAGGSDSLFPQNIPVGRVVNRITRTTAEGPLLEIQPCADFDELNFVNVVLFEPRSEVQPSSDGTQAGDD